MSIHELHARVLEAKQELSRHRAELDDFLYPLLDVFGFPGDLIQGMEFVPGGVKVIHYDNRHDCIEYEATIIPQTVVDSENPVQAAKEHVAAEKEREQRRAENAVNNRDKAEFDRLKKKFSAPESIGTSTVNP